MAVVRKTKTAAKGKTSTKTAARPAAKKTTSTRTATRSTATKPATRTATRTTAKPAPKRATTTRTAAKPAATRTRKKVEVTPTRTAKAANARAKGTAKSTRATSSKASTAKKTTSRNVKTVAKPAAAPKTGPNRVVDPVTGFAIGTDSHVIATELLKGGADRAEIIDRCAAKLPKTSNRGTPKPVANMLASVLGKMKDAGFTVESSFILTPPTRASKARATRERNKRLNGG